MTATATTRTVLVAALLMILVLGDAASAARTQTRVRHRISADTMALARDASRTINANLLPRDLRLALSLPVWGFGVMRQPVLERSPLLDAFPATRDTLIPSRIPLSPDSRPSNSLHY